MELNFRNLNESEIEVRVSKITKEGVLLLLYKDARCDMNILDEAVGPMNWQRHHTRDNANCIVSIRDENGNWIEKEDTGVESSDFKEKGLASDSFKRACFNWGIGRELYTAPRLFVPAQCLKGLRETEYEGRKSYVCYDTFEVAKIKYEKGQKKIKSLILLVSNYMKPHTYVHFDENGSVQTKSYNAPAAPVQDIPPVSEPAVPAVGIADDEELLFGNLKGKKFKDIKADQNLYNTFVKLCNWTQGRTAERYESPEQQRQFLTLQKINPPAWEEINNNKGAA